MARKVHKIRDERGSLVVNVPRGQGAVITLGDGRKMFTNSDGEVFVDKYPPGKAPTANNRPDDEDGDDFEPDEDGDDFEDEDESPPSYHRRPTNNAGRELTLDPPPLFAANAKERKGGKITANEEQDELFL